MNDTPQIAPTPAPGPVNSRRRFFGRAAVAAATAAVTVGLGAKAFAHGGGPWRHGGFMGADLDPARLDEHLDRMLRHLYVEIDATPAQQQQLGPLVKSAAADLLPLRAQMRDARRKAVGLLSQDHIDRAALEALRAEQLHAAEQASRRLTQALADVADVLTPAQRKQLAERMGRWHGRRG